MKMSDVSCSSSRWLPLGVAPRPGKRAYGRPPGLGGRVLGLPYGSPIARVPLPISWDAFPGLGETDAFPSVETARGRGVARRGGGGLAPDSAGAAVIQAGDEGSIPFTSSTFKLKDLVGKFRSRDLAENGLGVTPGVTRASIS